MSDAISEVIVKGTLGLLIAFSVATWTLIAIKAIQVWRVQRQDAGFRGIFSEASALPGADSLTKYAGPTARLAQAGVSTWECVQTSEGADLEIPRELLERSLRRQIQRERRATESGLAILASIGTTSPFIGLFGTVWGIMHALRSISSAGSASLDVVAGPIGEALIATGVGIAVAIPALLAFNFFIRRLKLQTADLDDFANLLVSVALRESIKAPLARSADRVGRISEARPATSLREARV
jgi:biopolymer transport protein ExbB